MGWFPPTGARPANTCIPPSFPGNIPTQPNGIPQPQTHLQVLKILVVKIAESYIQTIHNLASKHYLAMENC